MFCYPEHLLLNKQDKQIFTQIIQFNLTLHILCLFFRGNKWGRSERGEGVRMDNVSEEVAVLNEGYKIGFIAVSISKQKENAFKH